MKFEDVTFDNLISEKPIVKFEKVSFEEFKKEYDKCFSLHDKIPAEEIYDGIKLPERATEYSAGFDFYIPYDRVIPSLRDFLAGPLHPSSLKIPTGIKVKIYDPSYFLMIVPRSSLGTEHGMRLTNTAGVIESDYYNSKKNEGHIMLSLICDFEKADLKKGGAFCQGIVMKYGTDGKKVYKKRTGGFGSTGQ